VWGLGGECRVWRRENVDTNNHRITAEKTTELLRKYHIITAELLWKYCGITAENHIITAELLRNYRGKTYGITVGDTAPDLDVITIDLYIFQLN